MTKVSNYLSPTVDVIEFASERGFCVSLEFGVGTQSVPSPESFGMDDMTESTDNAAW